MPSVNRLSGKVAKTPSSQSDPERYNFLDLQNAEPDLGVPTQDHAIATSNTTGQRVWVNLSENFQVDPTGNLIVQKIEAGTF